MMIRHYPFGAVESSPAISSKRVAKSAQGVSYYGLSEEEGKTFIALLVLADSMMKLKQVEGGEHVGYGEKSPFVGVEIVKEGGMPTDLSALAEPALNEGVGILIEQLGEKSFRIYKTRNVVLAGEVTSRVPNSAVAIEPAKGWVKPSAFDNKTLVIGGVVVGVIALGGVAYFVSKRKPSTMRANSQSEYVLRVYRSFQDKPRVYRFDSFDEAVNAARLFAHRYEYKGEPQGMELFRSPEGVGGSMKRIGIWREGSPVTTSRGMTDKQRRRWRRLRALLRLRRRRRGLL